MEKIYIHKFNRSDIEKNESKFKKLLPEWRRDKAEKYKAPGARQESIAAGRLLVMALAAESGLSEKEVTNLLDSDKHSTDERYMISATGRLYYNITHSGNYVAVAGSGQPVGLDLETKEDKDFRVTGRMFTEAEKQYVNNDQDRFRNVWTIKESFLKCTGEGIRVPLNSFSMDMESGSDISGDQGYETYRYRLCSLGYDMAGKDYYTAVATLCPGECSLSICSLNPNIKLDIEWVEVLI